MGVATYNVMVRLKMGLLSATKVITFIDKLKSPHNRLYPHNCVAPFQNFNFISDQLSTINYQYMLRGYATPNHPRRGGLFWYWNPLWLGDPPWYHPMLSHDIPWYSTNISSKCNVYPSIIWINITDYDYTIIPHPRWGMVYLWNTIIHVYSTNIHISVFWPWLYHEWISHMKVIFPRTCSIFFNPIGGIINISQ